MDKKVLFLIGSPKPKAESASAFIENRFIKHMRNKSFELESINLAHIGKSDELKKKLLESVSSNDVLIFISPVYLDTPPSSVIKAMELIAENIHLVNGPKTVAAVSVCGYPEALHNYTSLRIYKRFADDAGFVWSGGLAIGEGPAYVYAERIFSAIGLYGRLDKAASLVVHAITEENAIPKEAIELMEVSLIPNRLYTKVAILSAIALAIKDGVWNFSDRPHLS